MESHHFDVMNEQDWQHFSTSLQDPHFANLNANKYSENALQKESFHGHRLLEEAEDAAWEEEEEEEIVKNKDALWYYDYFWTDSEGQRQILNQIKACSESIESLNHRRLCVLWHQDEGLKLGMTDNADASAPSNMMEFNRDSDWNRIDLVDNLGKAAARGEVYALFFPIALHCIACSCSFSLSLSLYIQYVHPCTVGNDHRLHSTNNL